MKALLLAALAAVGLGGCYATPYGAYGGGYYTQPSYGYGYAVPGYGAAYVNRGYRAPVYRGGAVYVAAPGRGYRAAPAYHAGYGGHAYRRY